MDFEGPLRLCFTGTAVSDEATDLGGSCCVSSGVRRLSTGTCRVLALQSPEQSVLAAEHC